MKEFYDKGVANHIGWDFAHSFMVVALMLGLCFTGCAEKKPCYFQCYEKTLIFEGYGTSCGVADEVTKEECSTLQVCNEGQKMRSAWGKLPKWCSKDPLHSH